MRPAYKNNAISLVGVLTLLTAVTVIIGWFLDIPQLKSILPNYESMKFNTAICFILVGTSLLLLQFPSKTNFNNYLIILSILIFLIAAAAIFEYLSNYKPGIDELFVADKVALARGRPFPGLMSANTAICFLLFSFIIFGFSTKTRWIKVLSQYALHLITAISVIAIIGYIHGLSKFYSLIYSSSIALHTTILLFLLSTTMTLVNPSLGITGLFTGKLVGHKMARRLCLLVITFVTIFDVVRLASRRYQLFSSEFSISILIVGILSASLILIWFAASWLNRIDLKRSEAEEEMMAMNEELEERVQARTAELNELLERYRESESKFKTAFEYSAIGMAIVSLKGEWLKVNIRLCEMLSYTENELLSKSFMDITPKDDDYSTLDIVDYVINSQVEVHRIEKRYICGDQSIIWVSVNISVIKDENGKVLYFVNQIIDITARKKAEEELKSSEQKYKLLFDSSPVPLWIVSKNDLSVIAVNEAVTKHYGYSREELLQMTVKKLRPPEGWEKLEESYHQNFSTATNMGVIEHLKKDGTSIWVNIIAQDIVFEGNLVRLTSTNDVTEKLRAEELLKKNEANLQTILNNTDTAYALLGANLEILEYNNKALIIAEKLFNFDPKSNRKLFDTMPDSRRGEFLSHIKKVFEGETISYEVNYPQPGNKDFWYYVRMFPIADKNNKILGLVLAVTDITERKEAEQSLQSAYEQIKINITFIREIIWKQSHVLRSPLANLIGLMTMLRANPADKEVLDHIETEFERMDTVLIEMARDSSADEMNF